MLSQPSQLEESYDRTVLKATARASLRRWMGLLEGAVQGLEYPRLTGHHNLNKTTTALLQTALNQHLRNKVTS